MTRMAIPSIIDFEYSFNATANTGQIEKQKDWITGDPSHHFPFN